MRTFTFTWYRRDDAGYIYRVTETISEAVFRGGGYVPQRVLSAVESEVRDVDTDYPDAIDYLQEIELLEGEGRG
jgi:hypothetical protein